MIRKLVLILFICISAGSCAQKTKSNLELTRMKPIQVIPKEQQITYAIHINAKTPYEIYIDDIPLERFYESGMNATSELNPYLLGNGTHTLKVRYLPLETAKDTLLHPGDVYHNKDAKWNIFFVSYIKDTNDPLGYEGEIDYVNSALEVIPPPKAVPFWEQEFDIEIKDLPYNLTGWSKSHDLSKMDKDELKNQVFDYYKKIRTLMNEGNIKEYLDLNKQKDKEIAIATYDDKLGWYTSDERINNLSTKCKGNMLPLNKDNYQLKLYAYGRIVALERIGRFKNMGLIAKREVDSKFRYSVYNFLLHKPIGSDTFEIIRK